MTPFSPPSDLEPGLCHLLEPGVRRILAPNPSAFTGPGTNTYLLGQGALTLVDPGPNDEAHLQAILRALGPEERIAQIIVTHAHLDHSALAPALARATKAPVLAFGTAAEGLNPAFAALHGLGGGEGTDHSFRPDQRVAHGDKIPCAGFALEVVHTPGHLGNHIALKWDHRLFSGDHVMGWSSSIVSPPEGDMGAYIRSLERLSALDLTTFYPGHGAPIPDGLARVRDLLAHRRLREGQILSALAHRPARAEELTAQIYAELPPGLLPAAIRNVLAHLLDLHEKKEISASPAPSLDAVWNISSRN